MRKLLIALLLCATSAGATPPRVVSTDDTLVASTQTHLYVMRRISDNRGSHYSELTDHRLVEIDIATGAATQDWLIRSLREDWLSEAGNLLVPGKVTERAEPANLHAILAEKGAGTSYFSPLYNEILWVGEDGNLLHPERGVVLTKQKLREIATAQIMPMMAAYPGAGDDDEAYRRADRIEPVVLPDTEWTCKLERGRTVIYRDEKPALRLMKIACEDYEYVGRFTFHLILPNALWD